MDSLAFDADEVVILQISVTQEPDMVMDLGLMVVIMIVIVIDDESYTFNCNIALRTPLSHYQ